MPRIEVTLPDEMLASLDQARGLVPRATFVRAAVTAFLHGPPLYGMPETKPKATVQRGSASPSLERFK